jgi:methionyl-tRNA formyltransferase
MNIMIVGQKWLGVEALKLVQRLGHNIVAVSAPSEVDKLYQVAETSGYDTFTHKSKLDFYDVPTELDLIICAHAWCYITKAARGKALYGALGYHPSLLPLHRGRDAIRWAVHMNDKVTGGTAYWMDDTADAGAIAAQDWCHIAPDDTPASLWLRELGPMGLRLIEQVLEDLAIGKRVAKTQDETLATWEPAWNNKKLSASQ